MKEFNSCVVFDKEGRLLCYKKLTEGSDADYFNSLPLDIRIRAYMMLVLQEGDNVAKYMIVNPAPTPSPYLAKRKWLT